ncbi:hypothetical protein [Peristeroidobacter agariperforans]|uniref:hypothetical protein n=1 Tax=Peristeroidobacter agariperforans TaxID=268404 RepID=UPI00101BEB2D|nr:hypothetical protein [Peristeroidobacter agariperforans]
MIDFLEDSRARSLLSGNVSMPAPCRHSISACFPARLALPWNSDRTSFVELLFLIDRATTALNFPRYEREFSEKNSAYDVSWCVSDIFRTDVLFAEIGGEADGALLGFWQSHEIMKGLEDAHDRLIMRRDLPFQLCELLRELSVGRE